MPECSPEGLTQVKVRKCVSGVWVEDWIDKDDIFAPPPANAVNHGGILEELRKSKFTAEQIIKFFETIKPAKCGGG